MEIEEYLKVMISGESGFGLWKNETVFSSSLVRWWPYTHNFSGQSKILGLCPKKTVKVQIFFFVCLFNDDIIYFARDIVRKFYIFSLSCSSAVIIEKRISKRYNIHFEKTGCNIFSNKPFDGYIMYLKNAILNHWF